MTSSLVILTLRQPSGLAASLCLASTGSFWLIGATKARLQTTSRCSLLSNTPWSCPQKCSTIWNTKGRNTTLLAKCGPSPPVWSACVSSWVLPLERLWPPNCTKKSSIRLCSEGWWLVYIPFTLDTTSTRGFLHSTTRWRRKSQWILSWAKLMTMTL